MLRKLIEIVIIPVLLSIYYTVALAHLNQSSRIYVAGHTGLVGSALIKKLRAIGYTNLILRTHHELDLTNQEAVNKFFKTEQPE